MEKKLVVRAGLHNRACAPVSFSVGKALKKAKLVESGSGEEVPCQIEDGCLSWIVEGLKAGEEKEYVLSDGKDGSMERVEIKRKKATVDVKIGGELFTTYHFGKSVVRPYLNPLIAPTGESVLRDVVKNQGDPDDDHRHHRGVLVCHGDVNGVDDWSEEKGHGFVRHHCFKEMISGTVSGRIVAENFWVSKEEEKVITETRTMKFYNVSDVGIVDFDIVFESGKKDVTFGDTKEGGILSVRVATPIRGDKQGKIENAYGGTSEKETWGKRAHWCDYSGPVGSETVGVTVFDNPDNFRYPTYWHVRNYGLMTANPFALSYYHNDKSRDGSYTIKAGESLKFSYRLYVHRGDAAGGGVGDAFHNYVSPPVVEEV